MLYNFHTVVLFICIFNVSLLCLIYIVIFMYKALCTPWKRRYTNVMMYVCMYHGSHFESDFGHNFTLMEVVTS